MSEEVYSLPKELELRGISRRSFLEFCGALAVAAGLSATAAPRVAHALEESVIGAKTGNLFPEIGRASRNRSRRSRRPTWAR